MLHKKFIAIFLVCFLFIFNIFDFNLSSNGFVFNKNQFVNAMDPVSAGYLANAMGSLIVSVGFNFIIDHGPEFKEGCIQLYDKTTQNFRNIVDRVASHFANGDTDYKVSPEELKLIYDEVANYITMQDTVTGVSTFNLKSYNVVTSNSYDSYSIKESDFHNFFVDKNIKYNDYYKIDIHHDKELVLSFSYTEFIDNDKLKCKYINNLMPSDINVGFVPFDYNCFSFNYATFVDSSKNWFNIKFFDKVKAYYIEDGYYPEKFVITMGNLVENPSFVKMSDMDINAFLDALKGSGVFDNSGNITQNAITNISNATVADSYPDTRIKTILDGLYTGPDTNLPAVPDNLGILKSMYNVLSDIYSNVKIGFSTVAKTLNNTLTSVKSIPIALADFITRILDIDVDIPKLDVSGFTNLVIYKKFPFCIPFDFFNALSLYKSSVIEPKIGVNIETKWIDIIWVPDFKKIAVPVAFFRWSSVVGYLIFLINKTKDFIKW